MRTIFVSVVLAAVVMTTPVASAKVVVSASIEPSSRITETQRVNLVITAEGSDLGDVVVKRLPALTNLKVISGPSTRRFTSFSTIGNRTQQVQSESLVYALLPDGPGIAEIPAIRVGVGDTVYTTEPIRFEVAKSAQGLPPSGRSSTPESTPVFLKSELGAQEVWQGEPVTLDVTLYAGTQVGNFSWIDTPTFSNFWVEEIDVDPRGESYTATLGGRRYTAYPLQRKILVPTTPGTFTLDPYSAQFGVRRNTRDSFSDFFSFDRLTNVVRRTEPLEIRVKPLPEISPDGFSSAVGTFAMKLAADREEAVVNDAVALTVTVEGEGFLQSAKPPVLAGSSDLRIFEPKTTQSARYQKGRYMARKTWEWIVVPRTPGELALPEVRFPFFDTEQGVFRELVASPGTLVVRRGEIDSEGAVAQGDIRLQRRDIAFIKKLRGSLDEQQPRIHERGWFVALLVLPLVVVPAVVVLSRRREKFSRNRGLARSRRARSRARKSQRATEKQLDQLDSGEFHEAVSRSLVDYVADRFDRSASGMTYDLADELLASHNVDEELRRRYRSCLEICDFARYVPASGEAERKKEVLREAMALIEDLEKALP